VDKKIATSPDPPVWAARCITPPLELTALTVMTEVLLHDFNFG
jgi:hypothetical protein